eukprot:m.81861 g.81861  ORF g.81861 m.81861 type:complete len:64 (-) comp12070_c0_seq3:549-740(-)
MALQAYTTTPAFGIVEGLVNNNCTQKTNKEPSLHNKIYQRVKQEQRRNKQSQRSNEKLYTPVN